MAADTPDRVLDGEGRFAGRFTEFVERNARLAYRVACILLCPSAKLIEASSNRKKRREVLDTPALCSYRSPVRDFASRANVRSIIRLNKR